MIDTIRRIIAHTLRSLYQPFLFALVLSVLVLFFVMYIDKYKDVGIKKKLKRAIKDFKERFVESVKIRRFFYFMFCLSMVSFITLMNRDMWVNPVTDVIGVWGFYKRNGVFTTEIVENVVLFIPLVYFFFLFLETTSKKTISFLKVMGSAIAISFLFSLAIEMIQLFLRLGTWQLSDLCFNTVGGTIGGLIYWLGVKIRGVKK